MLLWSTLRNEFQVADYLGVDLKPKPGRLKVDSVRILDQDGWQFDVIDVDTYGEPWAHYAAICERITKPVTVFLTVCTIAAAGGGNISKVLRKGMGIHHLEKLPQAICGKLGQKSLTFMLSTALTNCRVIECVEAVSNGNARYFGLRLEKNHGRQNDHCLDGSHIQSVDGVPESFGRMQELLRRNTYKKQDGPEFVGQSQDNTQAGNEGTLEERPQVEPASKGRRRK